MGCLLANVGVEKRNWATRWLATPFHRRVAKWWGVEWAIVEVLCGSWGKGCVFPGRGAVFAGF